MGNCPSNQVKCNGSCIPESHVLSEKQVQVAFKNDKDLKAAREELTAKDKELASATHRLASGDHDLSTAREELTSAHHSLAHTNGELGVCRKKTAWQSGSDRPLLADKIASAYVVSKYGVVTKDEPVPKDQRHTLVCGYHPGAKGATPRERCLSGNSLKNQSGKEQIQYVFNEDKGTEDALCGPKSSCDCCHREKAKYIKEYGCNAATSRREVTNDLKEYVQDWNSVPGMHSSALGDPHKSVVAEMLKKSVAGTDHDLYVCRAPNGGGVWHGLEVHCKNGKVVPLKTVGTAGVRVLDMTPCD